ncbi:MAG: hypothetical protein RL180_1096 [Pseudomonadota bacterium]|jgi:hypothetical protein
MMKTLALAALLSLTAMTAHASPEELAAGIKYNKAGFTTAIINERLWVFKEGSPELAAYTETGLEPSISASLIGEGPEGMTLKAANAEVLTAFQAAQ